MRRESGYRNLHRNTLMAFLYLAASLYFGTTCAFAVSDIATPVDQAATEGHMYVPQGYGVAYFAPLTFGQKFSFFNESLLGDMEYSDVELVYAYDPDYFKKGNGFYNALVKQMESGKEDLKISSIISNTWNVLWGKITKNEVVLWDRKSDCLPDDDQDECLIKWMDRIDIRGGYVALPKEYVEDNFPKEVYDIPSAKQAYIFEHDEAAARRAQAMPTTETLYRQLGVQ